tara:strand:- start:7 stop:411 length:405 start_codon:yes stop_codon:yes gene_type:complete
MRQYKESRYWVSEGGRVSRYYPDRIMKDGFQVYKGIRKPRTRHSPEIWKPLKPQLYNTGYYMISLCSNNVVKQISIHRLVAEIYVPGYFEGAHVDHIDNNPLNNHYSNLQWCTKEYNHSKSDKTTFPLYIEWSK